MERRYFELTCGEADEICEEGGKCYIVFEKDYPGKEKSKNWDLTHAICKTLSSARQFAKSERHYTDEELFIADYADYQNGNYECIDVDEYKRIQTDDFADEKQGIQFVEDCIRSSMSSLYEGGAYHFQFFLDDGNILFDPQLCPRGEKEYLVSVEVDDSVLTGCENIEEFETSPCQREAFREVCERLYEEARKEISREKDYEY
jgi:hypothetical protein